MSEKFDIKPYIIIDTGTINCKSGFCTDELPSSIISCLVGRPKYASERVGFLKNKFFVGSETAAISGVLNASNTISEGIVNN